MSLIRLLPQEQIAAALLIADGDQALDTLMTAVDRHTGGHSHDDIALLLLEHGTHPHTSQRAPPTRSCQDADVAAKASRSATLKLG